MPHKPLPAFVKIALALITMNGKEGHTQTAGMQEGSSPTKLYGADIPYNDIAETIRQLDEHADSWDFYYRGYLFHTELSPEPPVATYSPSAIHPGGLIHIWQEMEPRLRKPLILHEAIEYDLVFRQEYDVYTAHDIATMLDRCFIRDTYPSLYQNAFEAIRDYCIRFEPEEIDEPE